MKKLVAGLVVALIVLAGCSTAMPQNTSNSFPDPIYEQDATINSSVDSLGLQPETDKF